MFLYLTGWLIAHAVDRSESLGARWFIYVTNWSFLFLVFTMLIAALVTLIDSVFFYRNNSRRRPKETETEVSLYSQNNVHWSVKIFWFLYILAATAMIVVFFGFWIAVYEPCSDSSSETSGSEAQNTSYDNMNSSLTSTSDEATCGAQTPYQFMHMV